MSSSTETIANQPNTPAGRPGWLLFVLALAGFALSGFLLVIGLMIARESTLAAESGVPFCGDMQIGPFYLNCDHVLTSRWADWFGVPVAGLAFGLYLLMLISLMIADRGRLLFWASAMTLAALAGMAGLYFIWIQIAVIQSFCLWCTLAHLIGIALAILLTRAGMKAGLSRAKSLVAWTAALVLCGGLLAGQWLSSPVYLGEFALVKSDGSTMIERGAEVDGHALAEGQVRLNLKAHPSLGPDDSSRILVEFVDPTCDRCRRVAGMLRAANQHLTQPMRVIVLFTPVSPDCNPDVLEAVPGTEASCDYVRLLLAVWLADPDQYERYYYWLFDHEVLPGIPAARVEGERRVGTAALERALADPRIDERIRLDLQLADQLEISILPGMVIGDQRFRAIPADTGTMVRMLEQGFSESGSRP